MANLHLYIAKWGHEERLRVRGPDPVAVALASALGAQVPLTLEVEHPCARSMTVAWSVDGEDPAQVDHLEEGITAEPILLTLDHHYPPGVHSVVATLDDGVGEPVLFSTTVTVISPATTLLEGVVNDDGLPAGGTLAATWEQSDVAAPVFFQDPCQPSTIASFTQPGSYQLSLLADDSEFEARDRTEIDVRAFGELNIPPTAHAGRDRQILLSEPATLVAMALDDSLPGAPIELDWVQIDGPAVVPLESLPLMDLTEEPSARSVSRNVNLTFTTPGQYQFRCVATDSQFTHSDDVIVHVLNLVNQPPTAEAGPDQVVGLASEALLLANAQDDGLPDGTLLTGWSQIEGPGSANFYCENNGWRVWFSLPGNYVLRFTANDSALTTHADVHITVVDDAPGPAVELYSIADADRVTSPIEISGMVSGDLISSWQLRLRPAPITAPGSEPASWTVLGQGPLAIEGRLGTVDPTLVPNGLYELQLQATDLLGRSANTDPITISIEGQYKPGLFSLTFTDLSIPVAGLPVRVLRSYDSRRARLGELGDFGIGWHLDVSTISLRKNRHLGRNWQQLNSGGWYQLDPVRPREIAITFPNDRVCRFRASPIPDLQFGYPIATARLQFSALPGTLGSLEIEGTDLATIDGFTGPVDLIDLGTFADFNPTRFRYHSPEGDTYVLDERTGLESITDRHGNSLTIDETGIHHSSGVSVQFVRDAEGCIVEIIDPAGNAHPLLPGSATKPRAGHSSRWPDQPTVL